MKAWNYSFHNFTGIYRLPKDISPSDNATLFIHGGIENKQLLPEHIDLSEVRYAQLQAKNVLDKETSEGLPRKNPESQEFHYTSPML